MVYSIGKQQPLNYFRIVLWVETSRVYLYPWLIQSLVELNKRENSVMNVVHLSLIYVLAFIWSFECQGESL